MRACPAPSYTCLAHTCVQVLFARGDHASFAYTDLRSRIVAYGPLGGCARASLNMYIHACLFCAMYIKRWALISFSACVCLFVNVLAVMLSLFPLPIPSPPTLGPNILRFLFPRPRPLGGGSPPQSWARGGDTYSWSAAAPTLTNIRMHLPRPGGVNEFQPQQRWRCLARHTHGPLTHKKQTTFSYHPEILLSEHYPYPTCGVVPAAGPARRLSASPAIS